MGAHDLQPIRIHSCQDNAHAVQCEARRSADPPHTKSHGDDEGGDEREDAKLARHATKQWRLRQRLVEGDFIAIDLLRMGHG